MRADSRARTSGLGSRQPPSTWSCMKSRRLEACWLAPCSWTSMRTSSPALMRSPARLAAARVHFQVWISPQLGDLDERRAFAHAQALLRAAVGARLPAAGDELLQLV